MSLARRLALLDWATHANAWVIEDDYLSELQLKGRAAPALASLDRTGRVIHIGTFSKTISPALRLGFMVVPPSLVARFGEIAACLAPPPGPASQSAIAAFMRDGHYLRHLRRTLAQREAAFTAAVESHFPAGTRLARPQGGYFLWLELPPGVDALRLHRQALARGISTAPGPIFSAKREFAHSLRLNFGHPDTEAQQAAIATLGQLVASVL